MIQNFEEYTYELTEQEKYVAVPLIKKLLLKAVGKNKAISNKQIRNIFLSTYDYKISGPRVRKIIQYIRLTGIVNRVLANSKGYYISLDNDEINEVIDSQIQRIEQQQKTADALDWQNKNIKFFAFKDSTSGIPFNRGYIVGEYYAKTLENANSLASEMYHYTSFVDAYNTEPEKYHVVDISVITSIHFYDDNGLLCVNDENGNIVYV